MPLNARAATTPLPFGRSFALSPSASSKRASETTSVFASCLASPQAWRATAIRLCSAFARAVAAPRVWLLLATIALLFLSLQAFLSADLHRHAGVGAVHTPQSLADAAAKSDAQRRAQWKQHEQEQEHKHKHSHQGDTGAGIADGKDMAMALQRKRQNGALEHDGPVGERLAGAGHVRVGNARVHDSQQQRDNGGERESEPDYADREDGNEMEEGEIDEDEEAEGEGDSETGDREEEDISEAAEEEYADEEEEGDGEAEEQENDDKARSDPAAHKQQPVTTRAKTTTKAVAKAAAKAKAKANPKPKLPPIPPLVLTDAQRESLGWSTLAHPYRGETPSPARIKDTTGVSANDGRLQVEQIQDGIDFSNMDRGWHPRNLNYEENEWDSQKLEIVLMPHSHVDPGWIKTVQQYFDEQTKHILDTVVDYLAAEPFRTFIWAEISFLHMWWEQAEPARRTVLRRLVRAGQFEIVTGGWVMTDEASAHVYGMVDQLVEGQLWVNRTFGVLPQTGWSIDPFGQSATMAWINNRAGLKGMVIDRIHWRLKQHMQRTQSLVFNWRQQWDSSTGASDILTHTLPFYLYDVSYTCGPDYTTCCRLDFGYQYYLNRPTAMCQEFGQKYTVRPPAADHVAVLATDLLRGYRKQAKMFRHNVILHPIGGDFRYVNHLEIHAMLDSFTHIMNYINTHPELHAAMRFGTLGDYFDRLQARAATAASGSDPAAAVNAQSNPGEEPPPPFPSLSGEFFPYSDRKDHHWTGFFSTRAFFKRFARRLEVALRAAEIHATLAATVPAFRLGLKSDTGPLPALTDARRALGLFMHHDAITGTSKEHVMQDYGQRLDRGLAAAQTVLAGALAARLGQAWGRQITLRPITQVGTVTDPEDTVLDVTQGAGGTGGPIVVVVPNSLPREVRVPVRLRVATAAARVVAASGAPVQLQQVQPVFRSTGGIAREYELWFLATVPALGAAVYTLQAGPTDTVDSSLSLSFAKVAFYGPEQTADANAAVQQLQQAGVTAVTASSLAPGEGDLNLVTARVRAVVDPSTGLLQQLGGGTLTDSMADSGARALQRVALSFRTYDSHAGKDDHSGAYLFMPSGASQPYTSHNGTLIRTLRGPFVQQVDVITTNYHHRLRLFEGEENDAFASAVWLETTVDLSVAHWQNVTRSVPDKESKTVVKKTAPALVKVLAGRDLMLHVETDMYTGKCVHADANGHQIVSRKRRPDMGINGNVVPITVAAFLQNAIRRLTLQTDTPLAFASQNQGEMEIMLDRTHEVDDNLGLGEPIHDNKRYTTTMTLSVEQRPEALRHPFSHKGTSLCAHTGQGLTPQAQALGDVLQHRPVLFTLAEDAAGSISDVAVPNWKPWPAVTHMLNLRLGLDMDAKPYALLTLQQHALPGLDTNRPVVLELAQLFDVLGARHSEETHLTGITPRKPSGERTDGAESKTRLLLAPYDLRTFRIQL